MDVSLIHICMNMDYEIVRLRLVPYATNGNYRLDHGCKPS